MINILFVCTGDTCRSTMASAIMKSKIKDRGLNGLSCSSAGLFVGKELNINENAKKALKRLSVKVPRHKATQLTEERIRKNKYVLTMTDEQRQTILNRFPYFTNVYSLADFVGAEQISDPYGKGESEYYNVARYLDIVTNKVLERIIR